VTLPDSNPSKRQKETEWQRRKRIDSERAAYVAEHGNACQICGTVPKTRGLQWDHDHKTGAHRGWLCHRCNRALPTWVTVRWLYFAAAYLAAASDEPEHTLVESEGRFTL
jgi:NAD-dependent dihydropyrimidine dehydrogenase PreA subunit